MFHLGSIDLQTLIFLVEPIEEPGNWGNGFEMIESHKSGGLETEFSKKHQFKPLARSIAFLLYWLSKEKRCFFCL